MVKSNWQARFGAARRAKDRALLAEVEKQIAGEAVKEMAAQVKGVVADPDEIRERIARAFGRPAT
jgi:hypothetical protein